jgi:hypothetical protein
LVKADLRGALFYKAEIWDAYFHETNLTGAMELEDWQLATVKYLRKAILPDGKIYNGRFNLRGDLSWACDKLGIDRDDDRAMADFYGVPVDGYRQGQAWAVQNLQELRQVAEAWNKHVSKNEMEIDR